MSVREFWREAGGFAKTAFVVAAVSLALNVGTYFGLRARGPFEALHGLHWVVMLLGIALVFVLAHAKVRTVRRRWTTGMREPQVAPLPRLLIAAAAGGGLYLVALLAYGGLVLGEGGPDLREGREVWVHAGRVVRELRPGERLAMERFELRIFSASWYFGALLIALIAHGALTRGEGERAAERGTGLERGVEADE